MTTMILWPFYRSPAKCVKRSAFVLLSPRFSRLFCVVCYNDGMKTETIARPGIIDALSTGLISAWRRPWLMLLPVLVDISIWLAPRVSIQPLVEGFMRSWQGLLQQAYTPAQLANMDQTLQLMRDAATQLGSHVNLAEALAGGWLGAPSIAAVGQVTRMTFISDLVLAPAGLSLEIPGMATPLWQPAPIQVSSIG